MEPKKTERAEDVVQYRLRTYDEAGHHVSTLTDSNLDAILELRRKAGGACDCFLDLIWRDAVIFTEIARQGEPSGTDAIIRYLPGVEIDDLGEKLVGG